MHSKVPRDSAYTGRLIGFLRQAYGISPLSIAPAERGFFGETWRVDAAEGRFFLKCCYAPTQRDNYAASFRVLEHLRDHGIDAISRAVKAESGALFVRFDGAVLGLFEWIEGEHIETDETKWPEYQALARIYAVSAEGLAIRREDFAAGSAALFFAGWRRLQSDSAGEWPGRILACFERNRAMLERRADRMRELARKCEGDLSNFYITHGDAGGNLILRGGKAFIVDWDDPLLAPPERDAWVMCWKSWAVDLFHQALRLQGIDYALRPERLAYYTYHYFFYYLCEYLAALPKEGVGHLIEQYFDGWIVERAAHADGLL